MTPPSAQWYAVYTHARMELWARSNLWERGFEVYLPQYRKQRRHARKTDWVNAPLFPRYLFVSADPSAPGRRSINTAPGVVSLVSFGERPGLISDAVIEEIRGREDEAGNVQLLDPNRLVPGDQVRLESGAMADHVGLFERRSDAERVVILLSLLGREVRVKVPSNSIARVL
ncbi:MAG: transcription termination/antitermination NusG family protein [Alphaproteobacteria bacterium]|jgi:transcriptional antiterminator RfaH|nr:transcription termination/antitermination NusG family protein [Alphaproteobacteria bacterium]MDP6873340.1 transcription termination/antitermination NusG family protein [Alphaproteobacteria bacterium]